MYLIDSHCHLHDRDFFGEEQAEIMLKTANERGVKQIINIGTNINDSKEASKFAKLHKNTFWTFGIHPEFADRIEGDIDTREAVGNAELVAIGEVGLDYHYPGYNREKQIKLLELMIDIAIRYELPCSFHVRDALQDFFAVVKNFPLLKKSVLHSFSDTKDNLDYALSHDFYVGINGLATFANLDCYKNITPEFLNRCLLETDAPFLTPAPKRGKINEPGNVADVATWLSRKLGVSETFVAEKTTENARKIFNLPDPVQ